MTKTFGAEADVQGSFLSNQSGQSVVEYILMVVFAIFLVGVMGASMRKPIVGVWGFYIQQITAACPGCPPNPSYRFR